MAKLILVDNYNRETVADRLLEENITEDDLDYMPLEAGSGQVEIPGLTNQSDTLLENEAEEPLIEDAALSAEQQAAAEENADKVLAFTKAIYKAMDYAADANYEEVAGYVAKQTKTAEDSVYAQRGDADWLTGKEVAAGAADGTVAGYYQVQQDVFVAAGAAEKTPVEDYVMLQNMIDAAK